MALLYGDRRNGLKAKAQSPVRWYHFESKRYHQIYLFTSLRSWKRNFLVNSYIAGTLIKSTQPLFPRYRIRKLKGNSILSAI